MVVGNSAQPGHLDQGWIYLENVGVSPDVEVEQVPSESSKVAIRKLEKAIEIALKELEKNPQVEPVRPAFPIREEALAESARRSNHALTVTAGNVTVIGLFVVHSTGQGSRRFTLINSRLAPNANPR